MSRHFCKQIVKDRKSNDNKHPGGGEGTPGEENFYGAVKGLLVPVTKVSGKIAWRNSGERVGVSSPNPTSNVLLLRKNRIPVRYSGFLLVFVVSKP
jgi:hypothetical protein